MIPVIITKKISARGGYGPSHEVSLATISMLNKTPNALHQTRFRFSVQAFNFQIPRTTFIGSEVSNLQVTAGSFSRGNTQHNQ